MKATLIITCLQFDDSDKAIKRIQKKKNFENIKKAREYVNLLKKRWRKIWGYRTKINYWYANKKMAYVKFNKSSAHFVITKKK